MDTDMMDDAAPPPRRAKNGNVELTQSAQQLAAKDDLTVGAWLQQFGNTAQVRISIDRKAPTTWNGKPIKGLLDTIEDELIDETYVKERFGGGTYAIRAFTQHATGKYVYAGQKTIQIAGDPRVEGDDDAKGAVPILSTRDNAAELAALQMTKDIALTSQRRAAELEDRLLMRKSDLDPATMALVETLRAQIEVQANEARTLRQQLNELLTKKPEPSSTERFFESYLMNDSTRLDQLRTLHASELRQKDDYYKAEIMRVEDRAERALQTLKESTAREVDNIKMLHQMTIENLKATHASQITVLDGTVRSLRDDLTATREKVSSLEAKKDKTVTEQLKDIAAVKEAFGTMFPDNSGEEPEKENMFVTGFKELVNSKFLEGIGQRIAGSAAPPPATMSAQLQQQARERAVAAARARAAAAAATQGGAVPEMPAEPPGPPPGLLALQAFDDASIKRVATFMEAAYNGQKTPDQFVEAIKAKAPGQLIDYVRTHGVDHLLARAVQLNGDSVLSSMDGKNWAREVAKLLTA
jgi:hypothetical protein